jgi:protein-disulfide isomerase
MNRIDLTRRSALIGSAAAALIAGAPLSAMADEKPFAVGPQALGAEDAPVTIVEYASLTCPHCAAFHAETWPDLKAQFIETGKVRFIMREVYFDKFGLWAAMVARCGGSDTYFPFVDVLMKRQKEWAAGDQGQIVENLRRIGKQGGLSDADLDLCLGDDEFARGLVADFQTSAEKDGVRSTPTFFINGELFEQARTIENFATVIDKHL